MKDTFKKYLTYFNDLEINKSSDDVAADLLHLNIKSKLKFYAFYIGVIGLGIGSYAGVSYYIKSDDFRKALIEKAHLSPISVLFLNDFKEDVKKIDKLLVLKENELNSLNFNKGNNKQFIYSYNDFLNDLKNEKIKIDYKEVFKNQIKEYKEFYFIHLLSKNADEKINLGGNEYTYKEIANKVKRLGKSEAIEKLATPSKIILSSLGYKVDENIEAISNAFFIVAKFDERNLKRYASLNLNKDAIEELKPSFFHPKKNKYINRENGIYKVIKLPILKADYKKAHTKNKKDFELNKKAYFKKMEEQKSKVLKLKSDSKKLIALKNKINLLTTDLKNYKSNIKVIEKLKGEITWNQ